MAGSRREREEAHRRRARLVGLAGFLVAAAMPFALWWDVIADTLSYFRLDFRYLVLETTPWTLMALGLLFFIPVAISIGRDPEGRFYPRARNAYAAWGVTLYILGFGLATQVAQLHGSLSAI